MVPRYSIVLPALTALAQSIRPSEETARVQEREALNPPDAQIPAAIRREEMISALAWIPKGASRSKPIRFELSQEEVERIEKLAR